MSLKNFKKKSDETNDYIIPPGLFDVPKKAVLMDIPSCPKSEEFSKRFMKVFTDNKYDICIKWITKNIKQLFKLKSRKTLPSCVIYEVVCSCQESSIGETVRNFKIRLQEHEDTQKDSGLAKHLNNYPSHLLTWKGLSPASSIRSVRQNREASIITLKRPSLNERVKLRNYCYFEMVSVDNLSFYL